MPAEVDAAWINVLLLGEEVGRGEHVVHLSKKTLLHPEVVMAAP